MPQREEHDVAGLGDIADGTKREVDFQGAKVLLLRDGDRIDAVGATCPHAGAPLVEGIFSDGRIICPWHKASFCTRTGVVLDPPAVDPLPRFDARVENGRILLCVHADEDGTVVRRTDSRCFVIVGGGAAGASAAQTLRDIGFQGRVVMLDRENRVPYDRTVLSKYYLSGEEGGEKSPIQSQAFYRQNHIERITAEVVGLDPTARRIRCADGSVLSYDAALLATGSEPHVPDLPGAGLGHVFTLRSRADAEAILAQAERSERAVVLGTSFIGMEVAASLRERGLDVTVVGREAEPFERKLGAEIGVALRVMHEKRGVLFRMGRSVEALDGDVDVESVRLDDGEELAADLVVMGLGVSPVRHYAGSLGWAQDGGLRVSANLCVTDGLYAAGDIASFPLMGDGPSIRVEHWRVAQQQGRVAAANMAGRPRRFEAPPVFWTIQYRKRLDYIGHASDWDDIVTHGDLNALAFLAYYVKDGLVAAVAGMGRDADTASVTELFRLKREWTPKELGGDPSGVLAAFNRR